MTRDWGHSNITDSEGQRFLGNQHKDYETMLQEQTLAISRPLCMSSSDPPGIPKTTKKGCYKSKSITSYKLGTMWFSYSSYYTEDACFWSYEYIQSYMKPFATNAKVKWTKLLHTGPWWVCSDKSNIQLYNPSMTTFPFLVFCMFTFAAGGLRRAVWGPCRRLTPARTGGCSHAEEIDGVRLQALQQIFSAVLRYLHRGDSVVRSRSIGQSVCRQPTAAHLGGQRLPVHLDICRAVAG